MNVVIVDNEIQAAVYLKDLLEEYEDITVEKVFYDSVEALIYLMNHNCEVAFLDIEMENINGICIAEEVLRIHPEMKLCFVTAYNEFAVKAFDLNAIDYVLKPYGPERLKRAIEKIKLASAINVEILDELEDLSELKLEIICAYDKEDLVMLSYHDVYYIEVLNRNLYLHTKNKIYQGGKTLNYYEKKFRKKMFFRVHKSYVVNMEKISRFRPKISYNYEILFHDIPDTVPVSRGKMKDIRSFFNR